MQPDRLKKTLTSEDTTSLWMAFSKKLDGTPCSLRVALAGVTLAFSDILLPREEELRAGEGIIRPDVAKKFPDWRNRLLKQGEQADRLLENIDKGTPVAKDQFIEIFLALHAALNNDLSAGKQLRETIEHAFKVLSLDVDVRALPQTPLS